MSKKGRKMKGNGVPRGPPNGLQIAQFIKKDRLGGALGRVPERCPEKVRFWRALDLQNEALASTGAQFSLLEGVTKIAPKWSQNGLQMPPKFDPRRFKVAPRGSYKIGRKMTPKWEPNRRPNGPPKAHFKMTSKNEVAHRRPPGGSQGQF